MMARDILVGTSGYSYRDWIGPFYPPGLPSHEMLSYYSCHFSFAEINSTYYSLPGQKTFAAMVKKVPLDFVFTVKAHRSLTHERGDTAPGNARAFKEALKPLVDEERLGAVLLQFPYSFHNTEQNRQYLARLAELFDGLPLVVEFRHRGWVARATWDFLSALRLGYTCVDTPRLKGLPGPVVRCTSPTAYVRFHGRNAGRWWEHQEAYERYDYLYSREELEEWVPRILSLSERAGRVFVAFNNHYRAQAVRNARMLGDLLRQGFRA